MFAQFEEKIYESYFNNELDSTSSMYFPLGQVQEGVLGMDSVAHSNDTSLWRNIGYPSLHNRSGENLKVIAEEMERHLNTNVNNIPLLKINLIFQYKRPEYMKTAHARQWSLWGDKYYRYKVYGKQQELLLHIERFLGNKALVLYASPAIHTLNNLIHLKTKNKIIESSNFKKASDLENHHYNTYTKSGAHSIACSEPEKIENFDLMSYLKEIAGVQEGVAKENTNSEFIKDFTENIEAIILKNKKYNFAYTMLLREYGDLKNTPLLYNLIKMKIIREISGIQWLIAY